MAGRRQARSFEKTKVALGDNVYIRDPRERQRERDRPAVSREAVVFVRRCRGLLLQNSLASRWLLARCCIIQRLVERNGFLP